MIDDLRGVCSPINQIAAMQNKVWRNLPQVREHRFKSAPIPMHIRHNRLSHSPAAQANNNVSATARSILITSLPLAGSAIEDSGLAGRDPLFAFWTG
jgi:hypothetical protein